MKKKNQVDENTSVVESEVPATEQTTVAPTVTVTEEKKAPGRPINPNSVRQQKLALKGTNPGKKGRPIVKGSARQIRLAEMNAKREAGLLKRGRPKMDPAVKAAKAAERAAAKAQAAAEAAAQAQSN